MKTLPKKYVHRRSKQLLWIFMIGVSFGIFNPIIGQSDSTQTVTEKRFRKTATGQQEDVQRYWGFDELNIERYLSLPYDGVMDTNLQYYFIQISILVLFFLPWAFMGLGKNKDWIPPLVGIISIFLLFIWVPLGYSTMQKIAVEDAPEQLRIDIQEARASGNRGEALVLSLRQPFVNAYPGIHRVFSSISGNRDSTSYPVMFGLFLLGVFLVAQRMKNSDTNQQIMVQLLGYYGLLWWFFAAGIPWYGLLFLPMLILFSIRGVVGNHKALIPDQRLQKVGVVLILIVACWSFALHGALRFSNYTPQAQSKLPFLMPVVEYQTGSKLEKYAFDRVYLGFQAGIDVLNENEFELIYRVGSFMPFFVEKNDQRVFSDNFLDVFRNLYDSCPDKARLAQSLNTYGYSYLIVNLKLSDVDQTPGKTLTAKFNSFMDFVTDNPKISLVTTDRITQDENGAMQFSMGTEGVTEVSPGSFAVYKILAE